MDDLDKLRIQAGIQKLSSSGKVVDNVSRLSGSDKAKLMREHNIKPGTDAWFRLWFSKPYLTGGSPIKSDK